MPKYAVNIGSTFTPFSYAELVAPLTLMTTAYNKLRDDYTDLRNLSELYKDRAEKEKDSPWALKYLSYVNDLDLAADELGKNGYTLSNHNLFSKIKGNYSSAVNSVAEGISRENQWVKNISELDSSKRPIVGKMPSLLLFIDNPMSRPNIINGSDVEKNAMEWAKTWSGRFFNDSIGSSEHMAFVRILKTQGINNDTIAAFMSSPAGSDFVQQIMSQYDLTGFSFEQQLQVLKEVVSGAMKGFVYAEEPEYKEDPLVLASLKEGTAKGDSEKTENPLEGIYMEDIVNEQLEKEEVDKINRFNSFVENGLYKEDFLNFFVDKVTEAQNKTNQILQTLGVNDKETLKQIQKVAQSDEVAQAIFLKLKQNRRAGTAQLDYEIFSNALGGLINKTFSGDKVREAKDVYEAVTNRGNLRINIPSLSDKKTKQTFFGNSMKMRGLEEIAMNPNAKPKFNKQGLVSMQIKESDKKQYESWIKGQLMGNATLHVVKWNAKTHQYDKTGDEIKAENVISENKEDVVFEPLSIHVIRSENGAFNAVMKVQVGKEVKTIELPTSSSIMSDNIQNAANAVYDIADLIDPKKSKNTIKSLKLKPIASVFGEDSEIYQLLREIKLRGYLLPEEVTALTQTYQALLTSLKNNISIIGTPGL